MTVTITREALESALERVVERHGADKQYVRPDWGKSGSGEWLRGGCSYVHNFSSDDKFISAWPGDSITPARSEAGCIIGVALHEEFGIPLDILNSDSGALNDYMWRGYITWEDGAAEFGRSVQRRQDYGYSWGKSLSEAKEHFGTERDSHLLNASDE